MKVVEQDEMSWWYNVPATKFWEGLPIGTGRFAAMILGKTSDEVIPFNDETLWTGGPYNPNNPKGPEILKNIRKDVFEKDWVNANKEAYKLSSDPVSVQCYQPMGRLNIKFEGHDNVENYLRKLSMDSALVTVSYRLNGIDYKREIFASYPDQVIVIRLTASKKRSVSFSSWLTSLQPSAATHVEVNDLVMTGTTIDKNIISGENGLDAYAYRILPPQMKWQSRLKIITEGGNTDLNNNKINVKNADAVTIILAGATNWKSWNDISGNEKEKCNNYISQASQYSYAQLKERHINDYFPLFHSCKIDLGKNANSKLTTSERMDKLREGSNDPLYISQYFQYGRYLLLAGARENTLAFNNHNIWLDDMSGRWRGRWTLNINLQECYWPVESTNLPNVNESLLLFTKNLAEAGRRTAKELYGCKGWTAHHGTDVWFNTAPTDGDPQYATFPMGGAWLMQQLFDHYLYEPDINYLKKIYPLLKGSAEFMLDFLVKDPETGWLVTCPSTSPENSFITDKGERCSVSKGSTIDNAIIRCLFRDCIKACKDLNTDEAFRKQIEEAITQLPPYQIGKFGQLQEWLYDFKESEVTHRHLSPLFGVYPDDDITLWKNPDLIKAVDVVLKRRGDINLGWSGAWKINIHARLEEPQQAYDILKKMLTEVSIHPRSEDSRITPSFEGNQGIQGITAGIAEMLMQSHSSEISLLPALPKEWKNGGIQGLRARGGYNVTIFWNEGKLKNAFIYSKFSNKCRVRTKTNAKILSAGKEIKALCPEKNVLEFNAEAGKSYEVISL
ncbi:MAG: glycoside hydrolase family 95 protein [Peptostreptococcaceae bacterium]|nr:glycoside hydrolase family 95 protein [Peptostreptococcaceae bacterium]